MMCCGYKVTGSHKGELDKQDQRINEDLRRLQSNVRLDLSLQKGTLREQHAAQELSIKECKSKIDNDISTIRTTV
jgi:phosphomannomutase